MARFSNAHLRDDVFISSDDLGLAAGWNQVHTSATSGIFGRRQCPNLDGQGNLVGSHQLGELLGWWMTPDGSI